MGPVNRGESPRFAARSCSFQRPRDYVIRVPGVAQSPLSNEDTAALLNWMARTLSDLPPPPGFTDYSDAEIQGLRDRPLVQVRAIRARLLKAAAERVK